MGNDGEQLMASENAEYALLRFDELDEIMCGNSDAEQHVITNYLKGGMDLHNILAQHEAELSALREDLIEAHVNEAESICALYTEFVECEEKLVQFEEEIITFQRRLADSADDMVKMQQQTVGLVRSIGNRRHGSAKLSEVYTVLQECDAFCDAIAHKEVDKEYLENIAVLEKKLLFLSANKELAGSAVDLETRPQLQAAAVQAGEKLQRFLSKRIAALAAAESLASIQQQQRPLEVVGQNVISFLKNYNRPIAEAIFREYVKRMSEVLSRHTRVMLRGFSEACTAHACSVDTVIAAEDVHDLLCNRDAGSPKGNHVTTVVPPLKFPVQPFPRRERSVSQHMRNFADRVLKPDRCAALLETSISDTIEALDSLTVQNEVLILDAGKAQRLDKVNSWVWHFVRCMQLLVSLCVSECRFVGRFFCSMSSEDEDFDEAEALARVVLQRTLDAARHSFAEDLMLVADRQSVLAGLRVVDIVKVYLCHLHNPVPLLLFSNIMELAKKTLTSVLHSVLENDQKAVQFLATLRLSPFHLAPGGSKLGTTKLLEDRGYAATLGPHPIVQRFSHIAGEVEMLNTALFGGSMVNGLDVVAYDPAVSNVLFRELEIVAEFILTLAKRHKNPLAQRIFAVNNLFYILATWRRLAAGLPPISENEQPQYAAPPSHIACVESHLSNELARFVDEDAKANGNFGYLFDFIQAAEAALGSTFFSESESADPPVASLPPALNEEATMRAVSDFAQSWQVQLSETSNLVKRVVGATMAAAAHDEVAVACATALEKRILKEYTQGVVEANAKMHTVVTRLFGTNGDMHAKLTSNTTVLHAVRKVLQS
ncbi:putative leucine-rich repeat protein [Trypanosoma grayi]|uniref:putative leucine-rich repeat protein n=1 Tax=Trypanosoma grayi TaxID=71804 RepID=UPI0004F4851E|nr:putative leucine-rich repeat protein [Trypanosoma grayi]KEG11812.1 putative leucine-rich repeat protein [Trypanosoma grayi]